jgi:peptidoglycan/LPS O-acetylase OafA/YrhL
VTHSNLESSISPQRSGALTNKLTVGHVHRLDTIRFLAALWVAISHGALPLKPFADAGPMRLAASVEEASFNGVAAVMVFFIVSGLCIHLPYSGKSSVPLGAFLVRRYLRVGLPLLVILFIASVIGAEAVSTLRAVTWSIYAEIFYYSIYPLLFRARSRWGWTPQIALASLVSVAISVSFIHSRYLWELGWWVWLWGLPIWISGCVLADWFRGRDFPALPFPLSAWRVMAWGASIAALWLIFHAPVKVGYQFSMIAFAPLAFGWLVKELTSSRSEIALLERLGAASYSLYLLHPVVLGTLDQFSTALSPAANLLARVAAIGAATGIFYFMIEVPSHRLARAASQFSLLSRTSVAKSNEYVSIR